MIGLGFILAGQLALPMLTLQNRHDEIHDYNRAQGHGAIGSDYWLP